MRWLRRDVDIAAKCMGATFILTGEDGAECFEGVESFKCLGRVLHRSDKDWPVVIRNIRRARQFWGWLEKLLRREGEDPDCLSKVLLRCVTGGATLWIGNLGVDVRDEGQNSRGYT